MTTIEQPAKTTRKKFNLHPFDQNITLEEALSQLHMAREFFSFYTDLHYATEVSRASRRYQLALENAISDGKIDIQTASPYLEDIRDCISHMKRMQEELGEKLDKGNQRQTAFKSTRRAYDIIGYYITLLGNNYHRINKFIRTQTEIPDNIRPVQ